MLNQMDTDHYFAIGNQIDASHISLSLSEDQQTCSHFFFHCSLDCLYRVCSTNHNGLPCFPFLHCGLGLVIQSSAMFHDVSVHTIFDILSIYPN